MTAAVFGMSGDVVRKRLREEEDSFDLACTLLGNLRRGVEDSVMASSKPVAARGTKTVMRSVKSAKKTDVRPVFVSESARIFFRNGHLVSEPLDKEEAGVLVEDDGDIAWNEFLRVKKSAFNI
uniref:Uncharacterized protein n=1 Tax=Rhodosorus marinus TaxID=101924 RepID=A0A7S2ZYZ0_9RHOD|mmetsp:Transcript_36944/g.147383  ORF Transcript_36944/g.147383 Transcript_36944/m.147383 type:complete len:123 (+) Transcript_36944:204-572(+)